MATVDVRTLPRLGRKLPKLAQFAQYRYPFASRRWCCVCGRVVGGFVPYRNGSRGLPGLMVALDVVGSDVDNYFCPRCRASDRERHLHLYLQRLGIVERFSGARVLHVAPEPKLSQLIEASRPRQYVRCDISPSSPGIVQVDIEATAFDDSAFDVVIANHVLEHVDDDRRALAEIRRVLAPSGLALLQTPFSPKLAHTWEDPGIDTDRARLEAYGQENHVRLYGADIFDRFAAAGFEAEIVDHREALPDIDAEFHGVSEKEPLFMFERVG